ncbi:MAG TPA: hypothetical protein VK203_19650 [Nostocaceae cyanobacterium]|nr:hypothetical protein [Nostocaceae cyanobacterium]
MSGINHLFNKTGTITRNIARALTMLSIVLFVMTTGVQFASAAKVPVCEALRFYGNAAYEGLCKNLSTGTNWVCELASSPDVHTTFNNDTRLHLTVRPCPTGERSDLAGNWPRNLKIETGQPTTLCNVSVQNYVNRFNVVNEMPAGAEPTRCRAAFVAARERGRISGEVAKFYLNLCGSPVNPEKAKDELKDCK